MNRRDCLKQFPFMGVVVALPSGASVNENESYVTNCVIAMREDQLKPLFEITPQGKLIVRLDGYAIVPKEKYFRLIETKK